MADHNPLDNLFNSETDESAVNALVASLESRLASPTNKEHPVPKSNPSVHSNHVGVNQTTSACTSTITAQNNIVHLSNDSGNINNSNSKLEIKHNQILGLSSIHANSPISRVNSPVNSNRTVSPKPNISVNKQIISPAIQMISQPQHHGNHTIVTNVVHHGHSVTPPPNSVSLNNVNLQNRTNNSHLVNVQNANSSIVSTPQAIAVHSDGVQGITNRTVPSPVMHINSHGQTGLVQTSQMKNTQGVILNSNVQPLTQKTNVHIVHSANVTSMTPQQVSNPSVITVRGQVPASQMSHVRPQVVTSNVVNTSSPRPQSVRIHHTNQRMPSAPIRIASSQPNQINIAPRPGGPQQATITLPPGIVPGQGAMLMKNEHGQIVIVQPQSLPQHGSSTVTISSSNTPQKVQYVRHPNTATQQRMPGGQILTIQPGGNQPQTVVRQAIPSPVNSVRPQPGVRVSMPQNIQTVVRTNTPSGSSSSVQSHTGQPAVTQGHAAQQQQQMIENVKKCKNFLSTLIKLAASQPEATVSSVRDLIQGLIDGKLEPEVFTEKLQKELKSSPQPYLVPFLKKSLPLLRQSLLHNKMTIDGVRPPPLEVVQHLNMSHTPSLQHTTHTSHNIPKTANMVHLPPKQTLTHMPNRGGKPVLAKQMNMLGGNVPSTVKAFQNRVAGIRPSSSPGPSAHPSKEKKKFETLKDDDDINDVATMGGVNLTEESRNILATNADFIGTQIRSCKDETFLYHGPLQSRITAIANKHGVSEIPTDVINLISHATQERLRHIVEKLSTIAEQRGEIYKINDKFESSIDVKSQLKFLEELDVLERKRHDDQEKEMLRRAAKSRSKHEDPEQLKLKQRAKDMQQAEQEEVRQREANLTALAAIGPRKKRKLEAPETSAGSSPGSSISNGPSSSSSKSSLRPRIKRVNLRDLLFLMEQDRTLCKSETLYRTFLK